MPDQPNTSYSFNPWMKDRGLAQVKPRPNYNNYEDRLQAETLMQAMALDAETVRQIRPPVGNVPFPPRTGYEKHALTIEDVLSLGPETLVRDTPTRQETGMQGSPRNSQGQW